MRRFEEFSRVWFLTWTTYATWLPGDRRGFVSPKFDGPVTEARNNTVGTPYDQGRSKLVALAKAKVVGGPVYLSAEQAAVLRGQFDETAAYRGWTLLAGAVMSNHVHVLTGVPGDPDPSNLLRDFKSYGSRALNRRFATPPSGTWWTEQGSKRKVNDARHLEAVVGYVKRQQGALVVWGENVENGKMSGAGRMRT